jgi:hypothetical protein
MKLKSVLCLSLLSASVGSAFGFANVNPPANYNAVAATYSRVIGDVSFAGGTRAAAGAVNVAGKVVPVPVAFRFGAGAGRVAAAAAFGSPLLFLGVTAAVAAYDYFKANNYEVDPVEHVWKEKKYRTVPKSVYCYSGNVGKKCDVDRMTAAHLAWPGACYVMTYSAPWLTVKGCDGYGRPGYGSPFQVGDTIETANVQETYYDVLTRQQFEDGMASKPVPVGAPEAMPVPVQWPVDPKPIMFPSQPLDPSAVPVPQKYRVPEGLPQPVPNTNPQQYSTPVTDIVPAPTDAAPWQVDLQPRTVTTLTPDAVPQGVPDPSTQSQTDAAAQPGCGLPDSPPCKIDETGTPTYEPVDVVGPAKTAELAKLETVKAAPNLFPGYATFFAAPAIASCSAFTLPRDMGEINPCPVVDGVRSVMAYIWALTALFLCAGMIKRAV